MFIKENFFRFIVGLLVLIVILHSFSLYFSLYWKLWWFDDILHLLGGAWLASLALWFIYFSDGLKEISIPPFFLLIAVISFSALGGVLWELFEFSYDYFLGIDYFDMRAQLGLKDTMSDLFFDLIGAFAAGFIFIKKLNKHGGQA